MYLCYIDESGTPDIPGNTSHFVLLGISIPISHWKNCETAVLRLKKKYHLETAEIHTGWIIRKYIEQEKIQDFSKLSESERLHEVGKYRKKELLRLQKSNNKAGYKQVKKNFKHTQPYIHLTYSQRGSFIKELAELIGNWSFARIFAECIDKVHFDPTRAQNSVDVQAFEQLISRFEQYLKIMSKTTPSNKDNYGLLIHDNNETVAKKHTDLMKVFHNYGTLWTNIENIIETPLFVNSELTSMIQIADLCAYSVRRYLENDEEELFEQIFKRADRKDNVVVGIRHFTDKENDCHCKICQSRKAN